MRFKVEMNLEEERFVLDYRPVIISLIKHSLTEYDDGRHFKTYYDVGKQKNFSFAIDIPNSKFTKDMILVPRKKLYMIFSTDDIGTGIVFFNALSNQKNKPRFRLPMNNSISIKKVITIREDIITNDSVNVIFKSPLCIRRHDKESNKDMYYSYKRKEFDEVIKNVISRQISNAGLSASLLDGFCITPIRCKKTVVRHHSKFIEVSLGVFNLKGNPTLLNYLYSSGIASRKSSGFGLIDILS
ncbi:CRISPR-associated endoribonuclease Cas6 [Clostridiaceae bacterium M8S5]|nr:CRISPR-associated endoribonuclease Cas6 [Clostridiaceae bacterium M8S5]